MTAEQLAQCAGTDAGNRSMRKGLRSTWSPEDLNAAVREKNRVLDCFSSSAAVVEMVR